MYVDSASGKFEVKFNYYTLYLYELEFDGRDLIKDVYGDGSAIVTDDGVSFNIAAVNWTAITKALWAGAKCANPRLPRYAEWAAQDNGIPLFDVAGEVVAEINKELFRFGVAAVSE
jgi:hypothetical protein